MSSESEDVQQQRKHVFVVNGDPSFLDLVRELLQDHRFNVTTTNFVPRTFEQIQALDPNLIVVDLAVGQQAGWDLLERLQHDAIARDIPVIVTSTDPRFLDIARRNQERYGERSYISKPLDVEELRQTVEALIGEA